MHDVLKRYANGMPDGGRVHGIILAGHVHVVDALRHRALYIELCVPAILGFFYFFYFWKIGN